LANKHDLKITTTSAMNVGAGIAYLRIAYYPAL
jgi:hypothetical protein